MTKSQDTDGCTRRTLATSEGCKVEECDCGTLHLTLGPVTLRLEREAVKDLHGTLASALERLDAREHRAAMPLN